MTLQGIWNSGSKVSLEYLANDGIWKEMKKSPGPEIPLRELAELGPDVVW